MKKYLTFLSILPILIGCNSNQRDNSSQNSDSEIIDYEMSSIFDGNESLSINPNETKVILVNANIDNQKYVRLSYESTGNLKCKFIYNRDENHDDLYETFFLEKDYNEFSQFLDAFRTPTADMKGYLHEDKLRIGQATYISYMKRIEFTNIGNEKVSFTLKNISISNRVVDTSKLVYLSNDYYKIGMSLDYGGALYYLEALENDELPPYEYIKTNNKDGNAIGYLGLNASSKQDSELISRHVNLINTWDAGRLIQQSYYGTQDGYEDVIYNNSVWCENPVQGGDSSQNRSQIIDYRIYEDRLYVKTRAMDWALNGHTTESYMENVYKLDDKNILVYNSFVDFSGHSSEKEREQEMPAIYLHYAYSHLVSYRGVNPWNNDPLFTKTGCGKWWLQENLKDQKFFDSSEHWVAWTNDAYYGIGIYVPNINTFLNGNNSSVNYSKFVNPSFEDPASYPATCYTAPLVSRRTIAYEKTDYSYCLSIGAVDELRDNFKNLDKNENINDKKNYF